jgi:hypothetical protein
LNTGRLIRIVTTASLYASAASILLVLFMSWPGVYDGPANLVDMVEGTAERPYVGRLVLPALTGLTVRAGDAFSDATGVEWCRRVVAGVGGFVLRRTRAPGEAFEEAHTYGAYAAWSFLCFIGFGLLLRALVRSVYPAYPSWAADLAPIAAMVVTPLIFFRYVSFVYDPMTLLVFALCLWLIAERRLPLYLLVFPIAVLSRETALLLFAVLVVWEWGKISWGRLVALGLYHVAVFAGLRALVAHVFGGNPGTAAKFQVYVNLEVASHAGFYVKTLLPLIPLGFLVIQGWREKPALLRRAFLVLGIPMVVLCLLFGSLGEMRTYYELWPLAFLLALHPAARAFGWAPSGPPTPVERPG